ncbi:MAG: hypothetical protein AAFV29_18565 [Myxococcota bacterium]
MRNLMRAVLCSMAPVFLFSLVEAKPPSEVKSKASMLDDELESATGGVIEKAKEKSQRDFEKLKKNRTYEAIQKKRAVEAARRKAEAEKRRKEAAARRAAAKLKAKAEREAERAKVKAEVAKVKASELSRAEKKAKITEIRAEARERRKNRKERAKAERQALRAELKKALSDERTAKKVVKELQRHNRRKARLHRVEEVAAGANDQATLTRVQNAIKKEDSRHEARLQKIGSPK